MSLLVFSNEGPGRDAMSVARQRTTRRGGFLGCRQIDLGRKFKEYTGKFVWIYALQAGIELIINSINKTIGDDRITGGRRMDAIE